MNILFSTISQVSLNQEDLNLLFRILAENLGEASEDLDKGKPRIQETGKRLMAGDRCTRAFIQSSSH